MKFKRTAPGVYQSPDGFCITKNRVYWHISHVDGCEAHCGYHTLRAAKDDISHWRQEWNVKRLADRKEKATDIIRRCRILDSREFPGWDKCNWFEWAAAKIGVDLETERGVIREGNAWDAFEFSGDFVDFGEFFDAHPEAFDEMVDYWPFDGKRYVVVPTDKELLTEWIGERLTPEMLAEILDGSDYLTERVLLHLESAEMEAA